MTCRIRSESAAQAESSPGRPALRVATWTLAGVCAVTSLVVYAAEQVALPRALEAASASVHPQRTLACIWQSVSG